jgi:hypothetical protein
MFYFHGTDRAGLMIYGTNAIIYSRSATLSSYAGDTALPGGRWDKTDYSLEETAVRLHRRRLERVTNQSCAFQRREALEEVKQSTLMATSN